MVSNCEHWGNKLCNFTICYCQVFHFWLLHIVVVCVQVWYVVHLFLYLCFQLLTLLLLLESSCVDFLYVSIISEVPKLLASLFECFLLLHLKFVDIFYAFIMLKTLSFQLYYLKGFGSFTVDVLFINYLFICVHQVWSFWFHCFDISGSLAQDLSTFYVFIKCETLGFWCVNCLQTKSLCTPRSSSTQLKCPWQQLCSSK